MRETSNTNHNGRGEAPAATIVPSILARPGTLGMDSFAKLGTTAVKHLATFTSYIS